MLILFVILAALGLLNLFQAATGRYVVGASTAKRSANQIRTTSGLGAAFCLIGAAVAWSMR